MNIRINFEIILIFSALIFGGCDVSDTNKAVDCKKLINEQTSSALKNLQEDCVLQYQNSQSTDRKW